MGGFNALLSNHARAGIVPTEGSGTSAGDEELLVSESEQDSDDCSAADLERSSTGLEPERTAFDDLTLENVCSSLIHIHSGVLHILSEGGATFVCGRKRTSNYREVDRASFPIDIPVCIQCAKSLP